MTHQRMARLEVMAEEIFEMDQSNHNVVLPYPQDAALSWARLESDKQGEMWTNTEVAEWANEFVSVYAAMAADFCNTHDA